MIASDVPTASRVLARRRSVDSGAIEGSACARSLQSTCRVAPLTPVRSVKRKVLEILTFDIEGTAYGIPLEPVREVVRAVEVTPLAGAPGVVLGVIDYRGTLAPVFSLRRRFGLSDRDVRSTDVFIVVEADQRLAAVHADAVGWLADVTTERVRDARSLVHGGAHVTGAVTLTNGVVLLYDVAGFLSAAEAATLDAAITQQRSGARPT